MVAGMEARSRRQASLTTGVMRMLRRWPMDWRLKARIWETRSLARVPARLIACTCSSTSAKVIGGPMGGLPPGSLGGRRNSSRSALPRMAPRMLLKSWAMPPARVAMASSL